METGVLVCCIESLPRLECVHLSFHTSYHKLSLSNQTVIAKEGPITRDEVDLKLKSCKLDLVNPSHASIARNVVSLKLRAKPLSPCGISPPVDVLSTIPNPAEVELVCCFCNSTITSEDNPFRRVLPLPSESWAEFGGGIFCHYHDGSEGTGDHKGVGCMSAPSAIKIHPREGDCLFSASALMIHVTALDWRRFRKDPDTQNLHCRRCLQCLGSPVPGMDSDSVLSLSRSKVAVAHVEKTAALSLSGRWENYFALSLYSFAQSQAAFRFFIKNRQGQYYLHIWMLNVCSELTCNSHPEIQTKFLGELWSSESSSGRALKLLFKSELDTEIVGGSDMELPTDECLQLKVLLVSSNLSLPPAQRKASGYSVGYLFYQDYHHDSGTLF